MRARANRRMAGLSGLKAARRPPLPSRHTVQKGSIQMSQGLRPAAMRWAFSPRLSPRFAAGPSTASGLGLIRLRRVVRKPFRADVFARRLNARV